MRREGLRNTAQKTSRQGKPMRELVVSHETFERLIREHMNVELYLTSWFGGKKEV